MKSRKTQKENKLVATIFLVFAIMVGARWIFTGSPTFWFIGWNLFLAWLPLFISKSFENLHSKPRLVRWLLAGLWLLFLPNSFYIITDLIHLQNSSSSLVWFDAAMLFVAALGGAVMGIISLQRLDGVLHKQLPPFMRTSIITTITFLSGFGVYLGRFDRFNSWNVVDAPFALLFTIVEYVKDPVENYKVWSISLVFGLVVSLLYWGMEMVNQE